LASELAHDMQLPGAVMSASRRHFIRQSFALSVPLTIIPGRCGNPSSEDRIEKMASKKSDQLFPAYLEKESGGALQAVEEELWEIFRVCRLCPRQCGANRLKGEKGFCSSGMRLKVHSAAPHFGEERPLVGQYGSGTIFFSNCNLLCCFCQNWQINHNGEGRYASHDELAAMMLGLQQRGCHNINLVTPTHVVPHIVKALRIAIARGLNIPLVYNCGGYEGLEVVRKLQGIIDIYMPDFKYMDGKMASRYSSGAADYPEAASAAIKEMHRQVGVLVMDRHGIARRGLIIRHLVMPGNIAGTDRFVRWLVKELSPHTYVNIMAQYHPAHKAYEYPEISRRITTDEWRQAILWAQAAGLDNLDHL
jgi:putative pyruvate formate lyase activating enzyme